MTDKEIIWANDNLRKNFKGGRVEVCHGLFDISDRVMGRMLVAIGHYSNFPPESLHDEGLMLFAGFFVAFKIKEIEGERVMRVWVNEDALRPVVEST